MRLCAKKYANDVFSNSGNCILHINKNIDKQNTRLIKYRTLHERVLFLISFEFLFMVALLLGR